MDTQSSEEDAVREEGRGRGCQCQGTQREHGRTKASKESREERRECEEIIKATGIASKMEML